MKWAPIGASTTWRWFGYNDAWVTIDGLKMKSVTGGGHSGGGIFVSTYDQARFGYLFLRDGKWQGQQLISQDWIKQATTPSAANPGYGYMWWLNRGKRQWPGVDDDGLGIDANRRNRGLSALHAETVEPTAGATVQRVGRVACATA